MPSNVDSNCDILQPIPLKDWPQLQQTLKIDWPRYSCYYYWVENSIKWKTLRPDLALEIYCPNGKYNRDDATFVGISSYSTTDIQVFTKEPSGKKLCEAILKTNRIDWSQGVMFFVAAHDCIRSSLFSALDELRIEIDSRVPVWFLIKPAEDAARVEIEVPEECYLGDLNLSHISMIHSLWPHASKENPERSIKHLEIMITLNPSVGLFLKKGDLLVSWALQAETHGLGPVQTLDSHKRKGYAKLVVNALSKRLGKRGISPILAVVHGNTASENMFASLNWKRTVTAAWIMTKKHP